MGIFKHILWDLAERMDWINAPPRRFWKWLLRHYDKKAGFIK